MVKATGSCLAPDPDTMVLISLVEVFLAGLLRSWWNLRKMVALPLVRIVQRVCKESG